MLKRSISTLDMKQGDSWTRIQTSGMSVENQETSLKKEFVKISYLLPLITNPCCS